MRVLPIGLCAITLFMLFQVSLFGTERETTDFDTFDAPTWYRGYAPSQEIVSARTLNTKVFVAENGNRIYRIFSHPVHYVTEQGLLEDLPDSCVICENWQVGESYSGFADGLFEELYVCGQTATYIEVNEPYGLRGFVEFNTDAVPDTAIIDSLILSLNCVQWPIYNEDHDIWSMEFRPSTSSAMGIYYDAMDGTCYVNDYLGGTGWNSWELDSFAIEDFTNLLDEDWFAVGISDFTSASVYFLLYQCSSGYCDVIELGIEEEKPRSIPHQPSLKISPNPFSLSTRIAVNLSDNLEIPEEENTLSLGIYDISGRQIRQFPISNARFPMVISWDGRDSQGFCVPSGTYFCKVTVCNITLTEKINLVRQ